MAVLGSHIPFVNRISSPSFPPSSRADSLSSSNCRFFHDSQRSGPSNSLIHLQDFRLNRRKKYSQLSSCHFQQMLALKASAYESSRHFHRVQLWITASWSSVRIQVSMRHGAKVEKGPRHTIAHSGYNGGGRTVAGGMEAGCTFISLTMFSPSFHVKLAAVACLPRPRSILPLSPPRKQRMLQQAVQVELAVVTENWSASEDAVASAAVGEAVTLARAAAKAARDAAAYAEAQSLDIHCDFPSEMDLLRLERARLSEMERVTAVQRIELDSEEECFLETQREWSGVETLGGENWTSGTREANDSVASSGSDMEPSSTHLYEEMTQKEGIEDVVVRTSRREQRLLKRERALKKAERAAAVIAATPVPAKLKKAQLGHDLSDPVRSYLRDVGTSQLLTTAEEMELSAGIQDLLSLEKRRKNLMEQLGRKPTLLEWARAGGMEQHAFEARLREGQFCKDKMVNSNLRLVVSIAKRYQGRGMTFQDLIQEGSLGLIRGVEKFDPKKGFKFSTFAFWWIRQAITRAIADQSRTIRLPIHVYEVIARVNKAKKMLVQEHGRQPWDEEVAELLGMTVEKLKMMEKSAKAPTSMERPIGKDNDITVGEMIPDKGIELPEDAISKQLLKQDLEQVLHTLNPRERDVLRLRYGMDGGRMKTLEEIGVVFGVTRERIRQIESKALRKLRQPSRNNVLREYLDL